MGPSERFQYAERAKHTKHYPREAIKYTSLGVPMRTMEREKKIKMEEEKKAKLTIDRIIDVASMEDRKFF